MALYRVTVYSGPDNEDKLFAALRDLRLYWYRKEIVFEDGRRVSEYEFYVPEDALSTVLDRVYAALDLRRKENGVYIQRVEAGRARSRRVLGKRWSPRPFSLRVRPIEELIEEAQDYATASALQAALAAIAGMVAVAGIVADSIPLIIGAMLLSPILSPIYSMAVSLSLARPRLMMRSASSLAALAASAFLASVLGSLVIRGLGGVPDLARIGQVYSPGLLDAVVGVMLGVAVSLAPLSRVNESLIGVAVAAALIPPLAASALALTYGVVSTSLAAFTKALVNLAGLLAGSTGSFLLLISLLANNRARSRGGAVA